MIPLLFRPGKANDLGVIPAGGRYNLPVPLVQNNELISLVFKPIDYEHLALSEPVSLEKIVGRANDAQEILMKCAAVKASPAEKIDNFHFSAFCRLTNVRYGNTYNVTPNSRLYQVCFFFVCTEMYLQLLCLIDEFD